MSHYSADIKQAEISITNYFQRAEGEIQKSRINKFLKAFDKSYKFFTSGIFIHDNLAPYIDGEFGASFQRMQDVFNEEKRFENLRKKLADRYPTSGKRINESLPEVLGKLLGYVISTFSIEVQLKVYLDPKLQRRTISVLEFVKAEVPEFVPNLRAAIQRRMKEPETQIEMEKWQKGVRLQLDMFMVKIYRILG